MITMRCFTVFGAHRIFNNKRINIIVFNRDLHKFRGWLNVNDSCLLRYKMVNNPTHPVLSTFDDNTGGKRPISTGPRIDIPSFSSLTDYIFHSAHLHSNKIALIDYETNQSLRFDQLQEEIEHISNNLSFHGIRRNDVVTYFGSNRMELVQLLCALNNIGAIMSLANAQLTEDELAKQLQISGTKVLVATPECTAVAKRTATSLGIGSIFVIGNVDGGCLPFNVLKAHTNTSACRPNEEFSTTNNSVGLLPFSSGTTGLPKGVLLSNQNLIAQLHGLRHSSYLPLVSGEDVSICALPMVHIAGLVIGCLNALAQGATTVILSKFSPLSFLSAIQKYKGTFALIAPPIMTMLAKDSIALQYDLRTITTLYSGAAPLNKTLTDMVADRLKMDCIRQGYGMTETSPATHTSPLEGWKFGSVGVPLPNTLSKVVNPNDLTELGRNEEGEIWIRGPQVMLGYHSNQEATDNAFSSDGWLKTGDIGYFDADGHYFISDRMKDVIKYKGYQVAPAYLESILLSHPGVQDVAVVGVNGADGEEVPVAWVVLKWAGNSQTGSELKTFVDERVAPYKRLRGGVHIVREIPKLASGKIMKRTIRDKETKKRIEEGTTRSVS